MSLNVSGAWLEERLTRLPDAEFRMAWSELGRVIHMAVLADRIADERRRKLAELARAMRESITPVVR